jgi:hypothetical protein
VQAAEAYPREQRERRQLQTAMDEIGGLTKQWSDAEWREISHDSQQVRKLLALVPVQASYLSRNRRGEALAEFKSDIENFEYFELPKAMSLRQASADPLVYGDSDEWLRLSEANPEVAAEPDAELAAGTLLVVPRKPIGQP